jgi:predicted DNA-binding protein with PD1-like motif
MLAPKTFPITRRRFFAEASLAAAVPSVAAAAWLASAAPTVDAAGELEGSPDLPAATLLNSGDAPSYLLVFHTGQQVMSGLLAFARKHDLVAGHLTGIGAISGAEIGYFDPEKNTYLRHKENEQAELLSLAGNLALDDGVPFFHVHAALGMRDGSARGGHLFEATVRPTVELVLTTVPRPVRREIDRETCLPLLDP